MVYEYIETFTNKTNSSHSFGLQSSIFGTILISTDVPILRCKVVLNPVRANFSQTSSSALLICCHGLKCIFFFFILCMTYCTPVCHSLDHHAIWSYQVFNINYVFISTVSVSHTFIVYLCYAFSLCREGHILHS